MKNLKYLKRCAKAIGAAVVAGVGGIAVGYVDNSLTTGEFWAAISLGLTAGGAVFGIRNAPAE